MANKRLKRLAILPLLFTLGMTSCSSDELEAHPTYYNDKIVELDNVYHNIQSIIADAYHDSGTFQSDVFERVLYEYSVSVLGYYNRLTAPNAEVITLKEAVASARGADHTKAKKFINDHKAYQTNPRNDEKEFEKLSAKWDSIEERINEKMYEKISGSGAVDRNIFYEEIFVQKLMYDLKAVMPTGHYYHDMLYPSVEAKEVFNKSVPESIIKDDRILHRENYQYNYKLDENEADYPAGGSVARYIEDEILPTIYNELLVEQYVLDESYNVLGRSNARKVNVFTITGDSTAITAAKDLAGSLLNRIFISNVPADELGGKEKLAVTLDDFKNYSKIWNGVKGQLEEVHTISATGTDTTLDAIANNVFETVTEKSKYTGEDVTYYKGTAYGKLAQDFLKITNDPYTTDATVESTFTNSGAYTIKTGLQIKTNEIVLKNYTKSGWFLKNGGLTDLPESIRTRLFNIAVASSMPEASSGVTPVDRVASIDDGKITYKVPESESRYVARINGKYYLKTSTQMQGSDPKEDILFFDSSTSTYYIIQVEEAVNTAKFTDSKSGYSADRLAAIESSIVKLVAKTESYQNLAKKHWVEKMCIESEEKYHDQSIYNYFKTNYPDIFD